MKFIAISDLGNITSGGTPKTSVEEYWNGEIPWLTPSDLSGFSGTYFDKSTKRYITDKGVSNSATKLLPKDTLLFTIRAPIGYSALTKFPVAINQDYKAITLHKDVDPLYALFAMRFSTPQILKFGRGATIEGVNLDSFETVQIPLPSLEEQKRIAAVLDKADRLRRLRRLATKQTESFLQSVFIDMFGDPVENSRQWKICKLDDLSSKITDGEHNPPPFAINGIPYLVVKHIVSGTIKLEDCKFVSEETYEIISRRCQPKRGSTLFSCKGTVGVIKTVDIDERFSIDRDIALIETNRDAISPHFLEGVLKSDSMQHFIKETSHSAVIPSFYLGKLKELQIIVPPLELQKEFERICFKVQTLISKHKEAERQAELLFQSLLHGAFSGQLINEAMAV